MEQKPTEGRSQTGDARQGTVRCHWHPEVETGLSCSRCGRGVCPQCVVQAPVGLRCRECGRAAPMPTYQVSPVYLVRALAAGAAVAVGGGIFWIIVNSTILGMIPFVSPLVAVGVGYAAGELVSRATNRKRGAQLAWIAGGAVVGAFLVSWLPRHFGFDIWGLLFIIVGIFIAVQRVR